MTAEASAARPEDAVRVRRENALVAALCALGAAIVFWRFRELRHDDAFITFQYAQNVAQGHGFVFNPGEKVLGTTSPLHALLMTLAYFVFGDGLPTFAVLLGAVGVGAQAFFLFLLVRERSVILAAAVALAIVTGFAGGFAFLSLETNLFAALIVATVWTLHRRRAVACGVLLGLSFLCRYDAALLVIVIAVSWRLQWRELPRVTLGVSFAVVAPWLLWATWYFGSFLPQTFFAKQRITPPLTYLAHYFEYFSAAAGLTLFDSAAAWWSWVSVALVIAGVVYAARFLRALIPFFVFAALLVLAYARIGPHQLQHWHLYPALLAFQVAWLLGLLGWAERWARSPQRGKIMTAAIALASVILIARTAQTQLGRSKELVNSFWLGERHARYEEISKFLSETVRPESSLLALEVGTIGWFTRLRMIDPYGLISENAPNPGEAPDLIALVDQFHPDIVLVNTPEQGAALERLRGLRMLKVYPTDPHSTLLVRAPDVLKDPAAFEQLRTQLPERATEQLKRNP